MTDDHLYVIQNHLGLLKIGRAGDTKARFRRIARDDLCEVIPVAIREREGWREPFAHRMLRKHNLIGEWYDGTDKARRAVIRAIPLHRHTEWLVSLGELGAIEAWHDRVRINRQVISARKLYQRVIQHMSHHGPHDAFDLEHYKIWEIMERYEAGRNERDFNLIRLEYSHDIMPKFTTDIEAAMSLWPDDARPAMWHGSAWDCCVEALKIRRSRWMNHD